MKNPQYDLKQYKLSYDYTLLDEQNHITPEVRRIIEELHPEVAKGRKYLIKKLGRLIERFPQVPIFKQMLTTVHHVTGEHEKAFKSNRWLVKEHPNYLFGKINLVSEMVNNQEFDEIPEILGEEMELQALYPERKEFHVEEFLAFNQAAIAYLLEQNQTEQAEIRLEMMQEVDPDHPNTLAAEELLTFYFFKVAAERKKNEFENRIEVPEIDRRSSLQTTKAPTFNFPLQMQWIYEEDEFFPKEKIEKILHLDRELLIEDLEKALKDSIIRFDYFLEQQEEDYEPLYFPMNTTFLLIELKAEESLENILELLKQDDDFIEFWFGDYISEVICAAIYNLGQDRINFYLDFLKLPNINGFNKAEISNGINILIEKFPERRTEFLNAYKEILEFFIENADDINIADTSAYSLIVSNITDAGFKELLPQVKKLFELELIEENMHGNYEEIAETIQKQKISIFIKDFIEGDIYKKFEILQENTERFYNEIEEEAAEFYGGDDEFLSDGWLEADEGNFEGGNLDDDWKDNSNWNEPVVKPKKPGRNDPCPCGSGKKYKKCCMNK